MVTVVTSPSHMGNLYIAKAMIIIARHAVRSSVSADKSERTMLLPSIKFCSMLACMCCGRILPAGVGTGFDMPSALTPTITNLPAKSGSGVPGTYSVTSNVLLNLMYAVPSVLVITGSNGGTANSVMPMSEVLIT